MRPHACDQRATCKACGHHVDESRADHAAGQHAATADLIVCANAHSYAHSHVGMLPSLSWPQERLQQEEEWELALATRASMGCSPLHSHAEALAFKYWSTGRCSSFQ
jgi:hypothetical protein